MKMTEVYVTNYHGHVSKATTYAGPVRFTCDGDINTLMAEHSIWEPHKLFKFNIPVGGQVAIGVVND